MLLHITSPSPLPIQPIATILIGSVIKLLTNSPHCQNLSSGHHHRALHHYEHISQLNRCQD